ncbi:microsomal signal peptidase 12kDa subunit [Spinellus fusiger]|nr:microsomal signal peptidase 12kDa subunit [Spinellus fusiger]
MAIPQFLECSIDFKGQQLADTVTHASLTVFSGVALLAGYASQSLRLTLGMLGVGVLMTLLLVLPPWPMYNQTPLPWLNKSTEQRKE